MLGRPADRRDDVLVARATADLTGDRDTDLLVGRVRIGVEQRAGGEHHARRAEAALQAVLLHEALLHRIEHAALLHALDGAHLVPVGHRGEHGARLHRLAVEEDDAGAAVGRVAAPVRAGQLELVAQHVHEQHPRLDVGGTRLAVDDDVDLHRSPPQLASARSAARRRARWVSSFARWRLYSAGPRWSPIGAESSAARAAAAANASSDGGRPTSACSARVERTLVGLTALSANPAAAISAPSSQSAAPDAAVAQSPVRRLTFSYALPWCSRTGMRTSTSISASPTAVS